MLQDEGFIVEQTIPWATVPIGLSFSYFLSICGLHDPRPVKARDRWTDLHFDLNVNDRLGAYNSDLIRVSVLALLCLATSLTLRFLRNTAS